MSTKYSLNYSAINRPTWSQREYVRNQSWVIATKYPLKMSLRSILFEISRIGVLVFLLVCQILKPPPFFLGLSFAGRGENRCQHSHHLWKTTCLTAWVAAALLRNRRGSRKINIHQTKSNQAGLDFHSAELAKSTINRQCQFLKAHKVCAIFNGLS